MENASKALLMAGGMLIAIIIISMLMLMINSLTSYQQEDVQSQREAQIVEFNQQYLGYERDDVRGNELYSLINRTFDYNERYSNQGNIGDYQPMTITIDFDGKRSQLVREGKNNQIFTKDVYEFTYTSSSRSYSGVEKIQEIEALKTSDIKNLSNNPSIKNGNPIYLTDEILNNLVYGYDKVFTSDYKNNYSNTSDEDFVKIIQNFNSLIGVDGFLLIEYRDNGQIKGRRELVTQLKQIAPIAGTGFIDLYNEYVQFKRGIFECTNVEYSPIGRVIKMEFKFTGQFD